MIRRSPVLIMLALLAACGKSTDAPRAAAAGGQVLPATVSDSMLDIDRSQAVAPLQPYRPVTRPADDLASDAAADGAPAVEGAPANPAANPGE